MGAIEAGTAAERKRNFAIFLLDISRIRVNGTALLMNEYRQTTMRIGLKMALAVRVGMALLQLTAAAQTQGTPNAATNAPKLSPEDQKDKMSYAIGMDIGNNLKRGGVELDTGGDGRRDEDGMAGGTSKLTDQQAQEAIGGYRQAARAKQEEGGRKWPRRTRRKAKRSWPRTRRSPASRPSR